MFSQSCSQCCLNLRKLMFYLKFFILMKLIISLLFIILTYPTPRCERHQFLHRTKVPSSPTKNSHPRYVRITFCIRRERFAAIDLKIWQKHLANVLEISKAFDEQWCEACRSRPLLFPPSLTPFSPPSTRKNHDVTVNFHRVVFPSGVLQATNISPPPPPSCVVYLLSSSKFATSLSC